MRLFKTLFIGLSVVSTLASYSYAESVNCTGEAYDLPVYISTNPVAPYDQFVNKPCGNIAPINGDFYFVANFNPIADAARACVISGDMWGMKLTSRKDDGLTIEFQLKFGRDALRSLKVDKTTGHGTFFNVFKDGTYVQASKKLECTIAD